MQSDSHWQLIAHNNYNLHKQYPVINNISNAVKLHHKLTKQTVMTIGAKLNSQKIFSKVVKVDRETSRAYNN